MGGEGMVVKLPLERYWWIIWRPNSVIRSGSTPNEIINRFTPGKLMKNKKVWETKRKRWGRKRPNKKATKEERKKLKARKKKQKQNKSTPHRAKQLKWKKKKNPEIVYLLVVSFAPSWDQTSLQNYFFSNNNSDLLWRLAAVEDNDTLCYVVIHDCGQYVFCSNFYFSLLRKGDVFVPVGVVCFHFICNRQSDKTLAAFLLTSTLLFLLFCLSLVGVEIIKILLPFLERLCLAIG